MRPRLRWPSALPLLLVLLLGLWACQEAGEEPDPDASPRVGNGALVEFPGPDDRVAALREHGAPGTDDARSLAGVLITGGSLLDPHHGELVPNPGVRVGSDGRIAAVGEAPSDDDEDAGAILELSSDEVLMPGFIDLHAHYNMDLAGGGRVEEAIHNPLVFLGNGVTTTFPAGEYQPERILDLVDRIAAGETAGPMLLPSGPYFGSSRPGWDPGISGDSIALEVDYWVERGVRHFKAKGAGPSHIEALVERVHTHGGTVTGHLDSGVRGSTNASQAIELGIDRVEHILGGPWLDPEQAAYPVWNQVDVESPEFQAIVEQFLENQVYFNPTLTAPIYFTELVDGFDDWGDEAGFFTPWVQERVAQRERTRNELMSRLHETMLRTTLAFHEAGGGPLLTVGTDTPSRGEFLAGFSMHREIHAFVRAGIPEVDALRAATVNGARALGMEDEIGRIEPGLRADLVVVSGNPLEDIRATRNVTRVVSGGVLHDPAALLDAARGRIGPAGDDDLEYWTRR
ncbi:MAG: amidohydrolase [Gemmatimonadales bacterium]|nr:MAG: amidohydrolase [Gemmatimonadales bacterium]